MNSLDRYKQGGIEAITLDERILVRSMLEMEAMDKMGIYDRYVWYDTNKSQSILKKLEDTAFAALKAFEDFPAPRHIGGRNGSGHVC